MSGCSPRYRSGVAGREYHVVVPRYTRGLLPRNPAPPLKLQRHTDGFLTPFDTLRAFSYTGNYRFPTPSMFNLVESSHNKKQPERIVFCYVGLPGIEPGLYAPEAHVLPVYYSPYQKLPYLTFFYDEMQLIIFPLCQTRHAFYYSLNLFLPMQTLLLQQTSPARCALPFLRSPDDR